MIKEMLFIPGNKQQIRDYPSLRSGLEQLGHDLSDISVDWPGCIDPRRYAEPAIQYATDKNIDIVGGFSYGGAGAVVLASRMAERGVSPKTLILASHSAIFEDDGPEHETVIDPLLEIIQRKKIQVHVLYGAEEVDVIKTRAKKTAAALGLEPIPIEGVSHNIEHPVYTQTILEIVRTTKR